MENLPPAGETLILPLAIPVAACLGDHRVAGRAVLPAVEALQILARTLPAGASGDPLLQEGAAFAHLLTVDPRAAVIEAFHEFTPLADGRCLCRLTTTRSGVQARWTRRVEHAAVVFCPAEGRAREEAEPLPPAADSGREEGTPEKRAAGREVQTAAAGRESRPPGGGVRTGDAVRSGPAVFRFPARRLYADLVPFGPAFRNVMGEVCLTPAGAAAEVSGGGGPAAAGPLGSPFPLDAAFHLACVWGQRYGGRIVFPVGFERRVIFRPAQPGGRYRCSVVPLPEGEGALRFDLGIFGFDGRPVEIVRGVRMRDISAGTRRPPAWVRKGV